MEKALFRLVNYKFDKVLLELGDIKHDSEFDVKFIPSGKYFPAKSKYFLDFTFEASVDSFKHDTVKVRCLAEYEFVNVSNIDEIPSYFYANSIAILFPYIRAFISTVTLQANIKPLMLPTMNLSSLHKELKEHTVVIANE